MRVVILGMAMLAALAAAPGALAGQPLGRTVKTFATPRPVPPRPTPPTPVTPRPVALPAKIAKPNYSKRTMALIQQNIALQAAMRASRWPPVTPCKSSWSQDKLRRKGCLSALEPVPAYEPPSSMIADARLCASALAEADCGAVSAAREKAANGGVTQRW